MKRWQSLSGHPPPEFYWCSNGSSEPQQFHKVHLQMAQRVGSRDKEEILWSSYLTSTQTLHFSPFDMLGFHVNV